MNSDAPTLSFDDHRTKADLVLGNQLSTGNWDAGPQMKLSTAFLRVALKTWFLDARSDVRIRTSRASRAAAQLLLQQCLVFFKSSLDTRSSNIPYCSHAIKLMMRFDRKATSSGSGQPFLQDYLWFPAEVRDGPILLGNDAWSVPFVRFTRLEHNHVPCPVDA
jgi:hypothetical protein